MDLLIKNATIINATSEINADIAISDGLIILISKDIEPTTKNIIDATSKLVFPGFIDAHTHLDLEIKPDIKTADDFYQGTIAAAYGGTTTIIDYIFPQSKITLEETYYSYINKSKNKSLIDYGFHMTIPNSNEEYIKEISKLPKLGITSIKCFMAYPDSLMIGTEVLYNIVKSSNINKILTCLHCEDGPKIKKNIDNLKSQGKITAKYHFDSRPTLLEAKAVKEAIDISIKADAPIFIAHLSSKKALDIVKRYKEDFRKLNVETCPQYIFVDSFIKNNKHICSPPLRGSSDANYLLNNLCNNSIDLISTDHCPFDLNKLNISSKTPFYDIPNGLTLIEERIKLLYTYAYLENKINLQRLVALASTNPAKIFGLYPKKGVIQEGSDADIVIFDPNTTNTISATTHHSNVDFTIFEGKKTIGYPETVICRGQIIVDKGKLIAKPGYGLYQYRKPSSAFD